MFRPFRQLRKTITGVALGVWLFALFIGIAHGCGWVEPRVAPVPPCMRVARLDPVPCSRGVSARHGHRPSVCYLTHGQ